MMRRSISAIIMLACIIAAGCGDKSTGSGEPEGITGAWPDSVHGTYLVTARARACADLAWQTLPPDTVSICPSGPAYEVDFEGGGLSITTESATGMLGEIVDITVVGTISYELCTGTITNDFDENPRPEGWTRHMKSVWDFPNTSCRSNNSCAYIDLTYSRIGDYDPAMCANGAPKYSGLDALMKYLSDKRIK